MTIARTVRPIHFEDFGGTEFERLVFAYHLWDGWANLAWYGQTGSDQGRDIIGTQLHDNQPDERTVIQCVNRSELTLAKAKTDMTKAVGAPTGKPDAFKFVCRCVVSAERRDQIRAEGGQLGIASVEIWGGSEFEENLRLRAEFLLRRFVEGVVFPDSETELRAFVDSFQDIDDEQTLKMLANAFDRAAFRTPFHLESSLPAFQQAIDDTIRVLQTGVWQTREGVEIHRLPSLHHVRDAVIRDALKATVRELDGLRRKFRAMLSSGEIRHCACDQPACPVFMMTPRAARDLDAARQKVLDAFRRAHPSFDVVVA